MSEQTETPRDATNWARKAEALKVGALPLEAVNLNVDGRQVVGPLQGFGQLWQKTYRMCLQSCAATPEEVIAAWKAHFPEFQPSQNRFFPSVAGVAPGEVVLINAALQSMAISTGVLVLIADETSFTLMTPEGHPESGWVTFSAWTADGCTVPCSTPSHVRLERGEMSVFAREAGGHVAMTTGPGAPLALCSS